MLNVVLNMDTGEIMEMWYLMVNPRYKELWGKSYTTELGRIAQGIPGISKGTDTIVFITCNLIPLDFLHDITHSCVCVDFRPERITPIAHNSPSVATESTTLATAAHPLLTWSLSSSISTVSSPPWVHATAPSTSRFFF
jgi:hypothetical protein